MVNLASAAKEVAFLSRCDPLAEFELAKLVNGQLSTIS